MQDVMGRFSLGLVLGGAMVVGGVAEGGEISLSESNLVRSEWSGLKAPGDDQLLPDAMLDWHGFSIEVKRPAPPIGGGNGFTGISISTWGGDPFRTLDHLFDRVLDRVNGVSSLVAPVSPIEPVYTPTMGVAYVGSGVYRSFQGGSEITERGGDSQAIYHSISGGYPIYSDEIGDYIDEIEPLVTEDTSLTGGFGSYNYITEYSDYTTLVGSSGYVGVDAAFTEGDLVLGDIGQEIDLMSVSGRSLSVVQMSEAEDWIESLSTEVVANSKAWGTFEFGHAGAIFASVSLSNKGGNEKFVLSVTDVETGDVAYTFDAVGEQGNAAFELGGVVEAGTYRFEIETVSGAKVSYEGVDDDAGGELAYDFEMGVRFGVDAAYAFYQEAMAQYVIDLARYEDSLVLYEVEGRLREKLVERARIVLGLDETYLDEDGTFVRLEEVGVSETVLIEHYGMELRIEAHLGYFFEGKEYSPDEFELLIDSWSEGEVLSRLLDTVVMREGVAAILSDEELAVLAELRVDIDALNAEFEVLRGAYFVEHGVAYVATIPEPSGVLLLGMMGVGLLGRRGK